MRLAITSLFFFLLMQEILGQDEPTPPPAANTTQIRLRCRTTLTESKPLYIVDGYPIAEADIQRLNPNDIERIDILKEAAAGALYGRPGANGVVVISTKNQDRVLLIKDSVTGNPIPGATVTFISKKEKPDTLMFMSDSLGVVTTLGLRKQQPYDVFISSVGYRSTTREHSVLLPGVTEEIKLSRNQVIGENVMVEGFVGRRRGCRICCWVKSIRIYQSLPDSMGMESSMKLYPIPALRGNTIHMEMTAAEASPHQLNLYSLDGRRILSNKLSLTKGLNRLSLALDSRWTAGVYLLQVTTANGRQRWQQQLIIQ